MLNLQKIDAVQGVTHFGKTTIYAKIKTDGFPRPVKLSRKNALWDMSKVQAWIEAKVAATAPVGGR
ncbi:MAG: AlpA family phage regulatory protein [Burkholderiaceae bacterium]